MNENLYIKLFANCLLVKGAERSSICDLQRNTIKLIPNDLYTVFNDNSSLTIGEIKNKYSQNEHEILEEYFQFMLENEFTFLTDTPDLFPDLDTTWDAPSLITNSIIDVGENSTYDVIGVLQQLDVLNCKHIQIRYFRKVMLDEIISVVTYLDQHKSFITSIDFILPYCKELLQDDYTVLVREYLRINSFTVYNAPENKFIPSLPQKHTGYLIFTKEEITSEKHCGKIASSLFVANIKLYTESLKYNSCLNRKISIDTSGEIKNCPSLPDAYGNIEETSLEKALKHKDFKKYWNITKGQIDVCKDCEFRYVCTDCRAYRESLDDLYSKPLKCGYSPYTNKWEKWSTNPLKKDAIKAYGLTELTQI